MMNRIGVSALKSCRNRAFFPRIVGGSLYRYPGNGFLRQFSSNIKFLESEGKDSKSHRLGSFKVDQPKLMLAFTCNKCNTRSSHTISKQAYTGGTVMVQCPGCKNRHLIADHLKIFDDNRVTIEDIMKLKGESVSTSTNDLCFEDIPNDLKDLIGHYAKDAPKNIKRKLDNDTIHPLPDK